MKHVAEAHKLGSLRPKEEEFGPCVLFSASRWVVFKIFNFLTRCVLWITLGIGLYRLGSIRVRPAAMFECSLSI